MSVLSLPRSALYFFDARVQGHIELTPAIPGLWKLSSESWTEQGTDQIAYSMTALEFLHSGKHARVLKGKASYQSPTGDWKETGLLICKVAFGVTAVEKLRHEANIYSKHLSASEVCGDVPKFFGLYTGQTRRAEGETVLGMEVGLIVLEHCGEAIPAYDKVHVDTRLSIFYAIARLHVYGHICHNDLRPPNILMQSAGDKTKVKIIDFGSATKHAHCPGGDVELDLFTGMSAGPVVPCDELQLVCEETAIVPSFKYFGEVFSTDDIGSAQALADSALTPKYALSSDALMTAESVWGDFMEWIKEWEKHDPNLLRLKSD